MNLPLPNQQKRYPTYELVALAFTSFMFALGLVSKIIHLDWLFDTLYWLAGAFLVYSERKKSPAEAPPNAKRTRLLVCLYLFADSALLALASLPTPGIVLFMYAILSGLYSTAFFQRLNKQGIFMGRFRWSQLFQPPALFITLGILVPLICLYQPMLDSYQPDPMWTGPMVIYLPGTMHMFAGGTIDMGSNVTVRGCQMIFGHLALLLLAGLGILHLVNTEGLAAPSRTLLSMRVAIVVVVLWWLFVAKGYRSLEYMTNLLFIGGCALLLAMLFLPQRTKATGLPTSEGS